MQKWHKDADLEHIHELFIECLTCHLVIVHGLVIENLDLVLLDEE